jgi:hypothetical protein
MPTFSGAYWFYGQEKPLEVERHNKMLNQHKLATASMQLQ